jgi:hypothetical protein
MRSRKPQLFRIAILAIVGIFILGCGFSFGTQPTEVPTTAPEPTQPPPPTEAPVIPTDTAVPTVPLPTNPPPEDVQVIPTESLEAPDFYTEEFDGDLSNFEYFFMHGDEDLGNFYTDRGKLKFFLNGKEIYAYLMYSPYYYDNVMLTVQAENRGYNDNNVSLICRYDYERGFYEFSIANNGLYWIYYYDILNSGGYKLITNGGSTSIRTGKEVNEYTIVCNEKTLVLYINGVETKRLQETNYVLKEGMVGVGVSSFDVFPIEVDFEYMTIDYPY